MSPPIPQNHPLYEIFGYEAAFETEESLRQAYAFVSSYEQNLSQALLSQPDPAAQTKIAIAYDTLRAMGMGLTGGDDRKSFISSINRRTLDSAASALLVYSAGTRQSWPVFLTQLPGQVSVMWFGSSASFVADHSGFDSPDNTSLHHRLAPQAVTSGTYLKPLESYGLKSFFLARRASLSTYRGDCHTSVSLARSALHLDKTNVTAWIESGLAEFCLGNPVEARQAFEGALQLDPVNSMLHAQKGRSFFEEKKFAQALDPLNSAINLDLLDRKNALAYHYRGLTFYKLILNDAAAEDFRQALTINPGYVAAQEALDQIEEENKKIQEARLQQMMQNWLVQAVSWVVNKTIAWGQGFEHVLLSPRPPHVAGTKE